jgi:hypothetical protein
MGDYTQQTWTDDDGSGTVGTVVTAARMATIEAGVKDAAEHNRRGNLADRPAAAAANKNWLWLDEHGNLHHSNGSSWATVGSRRRRVVLTDVGSVTVSGLDGDTEYGYVVRFFGRLNSPGADWRHLLVRPNNDTGQNYDSTLHYHGWNGAVDHGTENLSLTGIRALQIVGGHADQVVEFELMLNAKAFGSGYRRSWHSVGHAANFNATVRRSQVIGGWWNNGTSNIVSLVFDFGGATCVEGDLEVIAQR